MNNCFDLIEWVDDVRSLKIAETQHQSNVTMYHIMINLNLSVGYTIT